MAINVASLPSLGENNLNDLLRENNLNDSLRENNLNDLLGVHFDEPSKSPGSHSLDSAETVSAGSRNDSSSPDPVFLQFTSNYSHLNETPTPEKIWKCKACDEVFSSKSELREHKVQASHWFCKFCPKITFPSSSAFEEHVRDSHSLLDDSINAEQISEDSDQEVTIVIPSSPKIITATEGESCQIFAELESVNKTEFDQEVNKPLLSSLSEMKNLPKIDCSESAKSDLTQPVHSVSSSISISTVTYTDKPVTITKRDVLITPHAVNGVVVPLNRKGNREEATKQSSVSTSVTNKLLARGVTVLPSKTRTLSSGVTITRASAISKNLVTKPHIAAFKNNSISITPSQTSSITLGLVNKRQFDSVSLTPDPKVLNSPSPQKTQNGKRVKLTCEVCDKVFMSAETYHVHMKTHRQSATSVKGVPSKGAVFECGVCSAQYPSNQGLKGHMETYHKNDDVAADMAIPIVDMRDNNVRSKLSALGIRHVIPLTQLCSQSNGIFCVPIVPVSSANNPAICNVAGIGASNLLPLGPWKSI